MTLPDLDALDLADFAPPERRGYSGPIPEKVMNIVNRLVGENIPNVYIPHDDPAYLLDMAPVFTAAADKIGKQARVWATYEPLTDEEKENGVKPSDKPFTGFRVSVGKKRATGKKTDGSDNGDSDNGDTEE